jgi:hypothetical protein
LINPNDSQVILDEKIKEASKKKYIWWGVGFLVVAAGIAAIIILASKKKIEPEPDYPKYYNPYIVS